MRQLIINKNPDKNGLVVINGKDFRYLRQVLRVKVGDMVVLRLADGTLSNSTAVKIDDNSKKITLQVCATLRQTQGPQNGVVPEPVQGSQNEGPQIEYTLFQFIPKPQKLELIVRQATECGVCNIVPVISEYAQKGSVDSITGGRIERLERIVREARQQSGSPVETKIFEPVDVAGALELWQHQAESDSSLGFILSERSEGCKTIHQIMQKRATTDSPKKIAIVCGNEGGISPGELDFFVKKGLFYPIHFSVNILRCETAALYGIAAVQTGV